MIYNSIKESSNYKNNKILGFTIVELIVVITILAILWTIWFVSYVWHVSTTRDANRVSQVQIISQAIDWNTKWRAPMPDSKVTIYASGTIIWYQWYAWEQVLSEIWVKDWWKDPSDGTYYTYIVDKRQKYAQILTFLENEENETSFRWLITKANATDYSDRIPKTYWSKLWVMVESWSNTPIQEIWTLQTSWLDVVTTLSSYTAYITSDKTISWTGKVLQKLQQSILYKWVWYGAPVECPEWFIRIPWNPDFNQPWFCVMKYEATYTDAITPTSDVWWVDWNTIKYVSWKIPVSKAWLYPIADISQSWAIDACKSMWDWYHLITNDEWMTIARNIEQVWLNWSLNGVWSGWLYRWITWEWNSNSSFWCATKNSNWSHTRTYVSTSLNSDTTKWWSTKQSDCDSKRQLQLSNWEIIWDLAWNVREHVNGANTLNSIWTDFATMQWNVCWWNNRYSFAWTDWAGWWTCSFVSPYTYSNFWPKTSNLNANNGIWRIYSYTSWWNNRVFLRGANANIGAIAGVFALTLVRSAGDTHHVGFRCSK